MKQYYFHINKKAKLEFHDLYIVDNSTATALKLREKTANYNIMQYLIISTFPAHKIEIFEQENLLDAIYKRHAIFKDYKSLKKLDKIVEIENEPGNYFPRIFRPVLTFKKLEMDRERLEKAIRHESGKYEIFVPRNQDILVSSINQLAILTDELNSIFRTIHPTRANYRSYGHSIRNLLILACTEVEAQLKGVLKSTTYRSKNSYTTRDYVKLKNILKLDRYRIGFNYYTSIELCCPFKNWNDLNPTNSLKWYANYNAVKHDREGAFDKASLNDVISAISALVILIIAQYGTSLPYWKERIGNYYNVHATPSWSLLEHYLPPLENDEWKKVNFILS